MLKERNTKANIEYKIRIVDKVVPKKLICLNNYSEMKIVYSLNHHIYIEIL